MKMTFFVLLIIFIPAFCLAQQRVTAKEIIDSIGPFLKEFKIDLKEGALIVSGDKITMSMAMHPDWYEIQKKAMYDSGYVFPLLISSKVLSHHKGEIKVMTITLQKEHAKKGDKVEVIDYFIEDNNISFRNQSGELKTVYFSYP